MPISKRLVGNSGNLKIQDISFLVKVEHKSLSLKCVQVFRCVFTSNNGNDSDKALIPRLNMYGVLFTGMDTTEGQQKRKLTGLQDAVNEVITRNGSVIVGVHFAEEVSHSGLLVVHELHKLCKEMAEISMTFNIC